MITTEFNDTVALDAFRRLAAGLDDMTPAMGDIGEMMIASTQDRMAAGVTPDGTAFAPRSPTTLKRYEKAGVKFGHPLNVRGMLRGSISADPGPDQVRIGSNAIQSAVMHFGAAQGQFGAFMGKDKRGRDHFHHLPWGDIPARPFLGVSESDRTAIVDIVTEWLDSLT